MLCFVVMIVGILVGSLAIVYGSIRYWHDIVSYVRGDPSRSLHDLIPAFAWNIGGVGIVLVALSIGAVGMPWLWRIGLPLVGIIVATLAGVYGLLMDRYVFPGPLHRWLVGRQGKDRQEPQEGARETDSGGERE